MKITLDINEYAYPNVRWIMNIDKLDKNLIMALFVRGINNSCTWYRQRLQANDEDPDNQNLVNDIAVYYNDGKNCGHING